jgi:serine/threonine protein kinase
MSQVETDRNLLYAVLALQDDFIDATQFTDVCTSWAVRMPTPVADLLLERGWITAEDNREITRRLERKVTRYGGNVHATLDALADWGARDAIRNISDPYIRQSLNSLSHEARPVATSTETLVDPAIQATARYTLNRVFTEGGLGRVWLANDHDLNREVALKEIRPEHAKDPVALRRFLTEAQVTGQLEHPNIVPVYELSRRTEDNQPFYTMRFIRGRTLREAIAEYHQHARSRHPNPLDRLKLLQAFTGICQAIGYAHSRGVIHRDLKPDNVLLGGFGEVIVLDWGLAKKIDRADEAKTYPSLALSAEAQAAASLMGQTLGTPAYMAPEQAEGRLDLVDERTDIYGLGTILYEILTGRPPHEGKTINELLRRVAMGESPRAKAVTPSVPAALDAICARAMAKQRSDRYARAEDLAEDVQRWLADEPVSVYPEWFFKRAWRWGRRHPWVVKAIGLITSLLIVVFLFSYIIFAVAAIAFATVGGAIGTLVGSFQGRARQGAYDGATFGFRVGIVVGIAVFLAWIVYELIIGGFHGVL